MVYNNNYMNHVVNINTRTTTSVVIRLYIYHSTIYMWQHPNIVLIQITSKHSTDSVSLILYWSLYLLRNGR